MNKKTFTFIGAVIGLITFLFVGLVPSLIYGGFAAVSLASVIWGAPVGTEVIPRLVVAAGMLFGLLATGSVFTVIGSVLGAGMHALSKLSPFQLTRKSVE